MFQHIASGEPVHQNADCLSSLSRVVSHLIKSSVFNYFIFPLKIRLAFGGWLLSQIKYVEEKVLCNQKQIDYVECDVF